MPSNRIEWKQSARKTMHKLQNAETAPILSAVEGLPEDRVSRQTPFLQRISQHVIQQCRYALPAPFTFGARR